MTEQEYINVSNLQRLRMALHVLREVLPTDQERSAYDDAVRSVQWMIQNYEDRVRA